jgi:hypothetical protein
MSSQQADVIINEKTKVPFAWILWVVLVALLGVGLYVTDLKAQLLSTNTRLDDLSVHQHDVDTDVTKELRRLSDRIDRVLEKK